MVSAPRACDDRCGRSTRTHAWEPVIDTVREHRRLYRARDHRVVAGVASGLARHLRVSPLAVRATFVILLGFNGLGLMLYAGFWAVLPYEPNGEPKRRDVSQLVPFIAIGLGLILLQVLVLGRNASVTSTAGWLVAIVAVGAGIIWHESTPERRRQWTEALPRFPGWARSWRRATGGCSCSGSSAAGCWSRSA